MASLSRYSINHESITDQQLAARAARAQAHERNMDREREEFFQRLNPTVSDEKSDRGATSSAVATKTSLYGLEFMDLSAPSPQPPSSIRFQPPSMSIVRSSSSTTRPTRSTAATEKQPALPSSRVQEHKEPSSQQQGAKPNSTSQRSATLAPLSSGKPPAAREQPSAAAGAAPPPGSTSTASNRSAPPVPTVADKQPKPAATGHPPTRPTIPVSTGPPRPKEKRPLSLVSTRQEGTVMTLSTVLRDNEIADLKKFHDNSLAVNSRKAYLSDYQSFLSFLEKRFPDIAEAQLQTKCTLEHVLAYLNQQCNDGKKIATINRRLSTIKKHILPRLFHKAFAPGSREEQIGRELDAIVRGMRRTVGAEQRVRGKRPLLIENIVAMCEVAALTTNDDGDAMPNTRCRDVCLLLFLFFSAMRRSEVEQLQWSDLTFDTRGVVVRIEQSKTDKESKGQTIAISRLEDGERAAFCPVKALEAWRDKSRGAGDSPVFRWISKKDEIQWRVLIDQRIVAIIKHYADEIGLDSRCFAAHSTRSGYVTSSSDRGVPVSTMMKRTRHKSLSSIAVYMKSDELFNSSGDRAL